MPSPQRRCSKRFICAAILCARVISPRGLKNSSSGLPAGGTLSNYLFRRALIQPLFRNQMDWLTAHGKIAYSQSLETQTITAVTPTSLPPLSLPFFMCLPMSLRSFPSIPNIIRPHSRNPQTNQIHFSSLHLQFLRFRTTDLPFLEFLLACVVCFCGLIDVVCGGNGGDAGETCVEDLLWGWLLVRFLYAVIV